MAIQEWTGSGVVGPIDVMGRSCAGTPEARARRCIGPGVSHGARSQGAVGWGSGCHVRKSRQPKQGCGDQRARQP